MKFKGACRHDGHSVGATECGLPSGAAWRCEKVKKTFFIEPCVLISCSSAALKGILGGAAGPGAWF